MKHGTVFTKPNLKWHEPQHRLLGSEYFLHAWGPAYVLSGPIARTIAAVPAELLRAFANEDVSVGAWLLAFNARHFDDRCDPDRRGHSEHGGRPPAAVLLVAPG